MVVDDVLVVAAMRHARRPDKVRVDGLCVVCLMP
jgi:hypothetical protein